MKNCKVAFNGIVGGEPDPPYAWGMVRIAFSGPWSWCLDPNPLLLDLDDIDEIATEHLLSNMSMPTMSRMDTSEHNSRTGPYQLK